MKIQMSLFNISQKTLKDQLEYNKFVEILGEPDKKYLEFDTGEQFDDLPESIQNDIKRYISSSLESYLMILFTAFFIDLEYKDFAKFAGTKIVTEGITMMQDKIQKIILAFNTYSNS